MGEKELLRVDQVKTGRVLPSHGGALESLQVVPAH